MPLSIPIGGLGFTMLSFCLTATVIGNAYYQKKQFYPSVVYITKSNPSMAAIYLMAFTVVILFGKLLKKIFFGTLRAAESEHLIERFFYAVTETCLAFTVFRDDFSPKFVALFTVLLFLKAFHWLADYRVDYMERSPVITRLFHIRVASLLVLLSTIDILLVRYAYHSTMSLGASVQLVFGFEYAILLTVAYNIGVKYLCHGIDLQSENPWENKAMYLLYTELFVGFIKVLLYVVFLMIMVRIHTFPLFIIRPMYLTMKSFKKALQDMLQSRRAIHNMNTLYPNATAEDLQDTDNVCIICREEMIVNTGVKKLPCNHLFHALCLRSWFQRQQTCPTCRLDILRQTPVRQGPPAAAAAAPAHLQQQQQLPQVQILQGRRPPNNIVEFLQQIVEQQNRAAGQQQQRNNNNNQQPAGNVPQQQGGQRPPAAGPFGGFMPPMPPFPVIPPQLLQQIQQQQILQQQQQAAASTSTTTSSTTITTTAAATTATTAATAAATTTATTGSDSTAPTAPGAAVPPIVPLSPVFGAIPGPASFPFPAFPQMGGVGGLMPPMPAPPADYSSMTTAELEAMEGRRREHVTARLRALDNIDTLVHAAAVQLTQYNQMMTRLDAEQPLPAPQSTNVAGDSATTTTAATSVTAATASTTTAADTTTNVSVTRTTTTASSSSATGNGSVASGGTSSAVTSSDSPSAGQPNEDNDASELRRRRMERFGVRTSPPLPSSSGGPPEETEATN